MNLRESMAEIERELRTITTIWRSNMDIRRVDFADQQYAFGAGDASSVAADLIAAALARDAENGEKGLNFSELIDKMSPEAQNRLREIATEQLFASSPAEVYDREHTR